MNEETKKALENSIKKWEDIVEEEGVDEGSSNCALCKRFAACQNCPVMKRTNRLGCHDTPYTEWHNHQSVTHTFAYSRKILCPACKELAIKELEFLKSLREKDE